MEDFPLKLIKDKLLLKLIMAQCDAWNLDSFT